MKKINYLKKVFTVLSFVPILLAAQFNTITPLAIKKEATTNYFEKERQLQKEKMKEKEEKPNSKKQKMSSKEEIKQELDSLKGMLLKYTLKNNFQSSLKYKKLEDSLKNIQKNYMSKQEFKRMDLIDEPSYSLSKIFMPLARRLDITSPYGKRIHPIFGTHKMHYGIDIAASYEHVHAVLDGVVTEAGWDSKGGGNYIKISHAGRFETAYLHLSEAYYRRGEQVKAGFVIAKSGNSGNSTGPHLHFSVKEYGSFINPLTFLNDLIKVNNLLALSYGK